MRRFLLGLLLSVSCSVAFTAEIIIDPKMTTGPLGLGEFQPEALSGLPVINLQIPLPGEIESNLPRAQGKPDGGFDVQSQAQNAFGDVPGLGVFISLDVDIDLPGIDGLPIKSARARQVNEPRIPGFDGLPLGFGRQ